MNRWIKENRKWKNKKALSFSSIFLGSTHATLRRVIIAYLETLDMLYRGSTRDLDKGKSTWLIACKLFETRMYVHVCGVYIWLF